jgi:hypothetical protein
VPRGERAIRLYGGGALGTCDGKDAVKIGMRKPCRGLKHQSFKVLDQVSGKGGKPYGNCAGVSKKEGLNDGGD